MARQTNAYVLFVQIYGADKQIPDSAQTATAILGGVKVNYKTVGVTDAVPVQDPETREKPQKGGEEVQGRRKEEAERGGMD